jgi:DNA-binding MarR family transcriptional regulator
MTTAAGLANLLEYVGEEVSHECSIQTLRTFLFIAARGKCQQKDVEIYLKVPNSTASRNVSYWTARKFDRSPGMDYVKREEDDYDRRARNLTLTRRGQAFYDKLKEKM